MNIGERTLQNILSDPDRLRVVVKCAILYSKGGSFRGIAGELRETYNTHISEATAARYIRAAESLGYIEVEINVPHQEETAESLRREYGLREVHIFPRGVSGQIEDLMVALTAAYLEKRLGYGVRKRKGDAKRDAKSIAIGPGSVNFEIAEAMPYEPRSDIELGSTASATLQEHYLSSNIIAGTLSRKWGCKLYRFDHRRSFQDQRRYLSKFDIFVFGVERVLDTKEATGLTLLSETGDSDSKVLQNLRKLLRHGVTGFINYQPIDMEGQIVKWENMGEIGGEYGKILKDPPIKLDELKKLVQKQGEHKWIICVAAGLDKVRAIAAALTGGYFNVLITDYETAKAL